MEKINLDPFICNLVDRHTKYLRIYSWSIRLEVNIRRKLYKRSPNKGN